MSFPEVLLWQRLRKETHGLRFRRQHPVGPFVVDFYCAELKLAVEMDGSVRHTEEAIAYDARRDAWLRHQGILRVPARVVFEDMDSAIWAITATAEELRANTAALASSTRPSSRPGPPPPRSAAPGREEEFGGTG